MKQILILLLIAAAAVGGYLLFTNNAEAPSGEESAVEFTRGPFTFVCADGTELTTEYSERSDTARVALPDGTFTLERATSASGARYANADETVVFWDRGGEVTVALEGETAYESCAQLTDTTVDITPISHATFVMDIDGTTIYNDPVGGATAFTGQPTPDLILLSHTHGDHLSIETLEDVVDNETMIIAPQAVFDELSDELQFRTVVLENDETTNALGISIEAIPMYNLPEQGVEVRHENGHGNGYVLEVGDKRVYIAGDTADTPEMRELADIDIAFVPMNLPYTMSVERAADGVLAFAPARVYPYHYRGEDGLADVEQFRTLITDANPDIEVVLLDWYPDAE